MSVESHHKLKINESSGEFTPVAHVPQPILGNTDFACPISGWFRNAEHRFRLYGFDSRAPGCIPQHFAFLRLQLILLFQLGLEASEELSQQSVCTLY